MKIIKPRIVEKEVIKEVESKELIKNNENLKRISFSTSLYT